MDNSGTVVGQWWDSSGTIIEINETLEGILELLIKNPTSSIRQISRELSLSKSTTHRQIKVLINRRHIVKEGGTKRRWIVLLRKY